MKAEEIKTMDDAQNYCEGVINDFEGGVSTKEETMRALRDYTFALMDLFLRNYKSNQKCDQCGTSEVITKGHCNICGAKQKT